MGEIRSDWQMKRARDKAVSEHNEMKESKASTTLKNLLTSMIAVNNYPVHKAILLVENLEGCQWMEEKVLNEAPPEAFSIKTDIIQGGYDRGDYVALLLGQRIHKSLQYIKEMGGIEFLLDFGLDSDCAKRRMLSIPGVGPKVLATFISLQFR